MKSLFVLVLGVMLAVLFCGKLTYGSSVRPIKLMRATSFPLGSGGNAAPLNPQDAALINDAINAVAESNAAQPQETQRGPQTHHNLESETEGNMNGKYAAKPFNVFTKASK